MDKRDSELLKRVLEDESFEPSEGDEVKAALVRHFETARKKAVLRMALWIAGGMLIFFYGAYLLGRAVDTRSMLAALVVMIIGFETTVLIKLWYWTVDSKITLLKEIKRAQLSSLAGHPGDNKEPLPFAAASGAGERADLGRTDVKRISDSHPVPRSRPTHPPWRRNRLPGRRRHAGD